MAADHRFHLDQEQSGKDKRQRERHFHAVEVPLLRVIGFSMITLLVLLRYVFVPDSGDAHALWVGIIGLAYSLVAWAVLWWLAAAWLLLAAGVVLLSGGWSHLRRLAFPLAFVLFALPVPARVMGPLQYGLQSATTTAAAAVLPVVGIPVERTGFLLTVPGGGLNVTEACSGVRSVTALTALTTRSHGTSSKNFWTSRSITQSYFQHRARHAAIASWADLRGR